MAASSCRCVEDVCTRSLRQSLRLYVGRRIQIGLVSGRTSFIVGTVLSVSTGLVVLQVAGRRNYVALCEIDYFKPR